MVYAQEIKSWSICPKNKYLRLTGTSQAAAIVSNFIAKNIENSKPLFENTKRAKCLSAKVLHGYIDFNEIH